jgi:hypothetical protein
MEYPDKEGFWLCPEQHDGEIEVYKVPSGLLCVWCEDVGASHYEPIGAFRDDMIGHMSVNVMPGNWTFLRPLDAE